MIKIQPDAKGDRGATLIIDDQHRFEASVKKSPQALDVLKKYADQCAEPVGDFLLCDASPALTLAWATFPKDRSTFSLLKLARQIFSALKDRRRSHITIDLERCKHPDVWIDVMVAAYGAAQFKPELYKRKDTDKKSASASKKPFSELIFKTSKQHEPTLQLAQAKADQTNLVRRLSILPANKLTPGLYAKEVTKIAAPLKIKVETLDTSKLKKLGCGAFLAVAQGSSHDDAAIIKLTYNGRKGDGVDLTWVGKGVTFDTGGVNVKPGNSMNGMHGDMAGSAVALGLICLAASQQWPYRIEAYLAIADNAIGNAAYRPNEVVTAANGLSIETVHTDAEGRMMLSDTLALASREKPRFIVDFATLTGSAVRAIGTNYSAAFSNQSALHAAIISAGVESGERVWPFPTDSDYGECLESEIADTKQCRLAAGPDHIEAALFLSKFVDENIAWIHVDLAAAENDGGLAHVPTKETGFGIRFGAELAKQLLDKKTK